ncbi:MAG: molybdenum cofactor cytidylyltransferase [Paraglaciecola sp.]
MKTELMMLAAGQSKRFGGIKQLTDIGGQPMICHCLSQYRQGEKWLDGISNGCVVLGSNAVLITQALPDNVNKYVVDLWLNGMGYVLAQSIHNIAVDTSHVLIGLADQVAISQSMISQLLDESQKHQGHIIAAQYNSGLGAPVIFPKDYFCELSQLTGDKGAKELLQQYPQKIISLAMPAAALDVDTPEDLKLL